MRCTTAEVGAAGAATIGLLACHSVQPYTVCSERLQFHVKLQSIHLPCPQQKQTGSRPQSAGKGWVSPQIYPSDTFRPQWFLRRSCHGARPAVLLKASHQLFILSIQGLDLHNPPPPVPLKCPSFSWSSLMRCQPHPAVQHFSLQALAPAQQNRNPSCHKLLRTPNLS